MFVKKSPFVVPVALCILFLLAPGAANSGGIKEKQGAAKGPAVMWREPGDIGGRDLFYGAGGKEHAPHGTFSFVKEDLDGTNPKFVVRDEDGTQWKVKLGQEVRPETAASRLVWAVGYATNEEYFVPHLQVKEMPAHLHRGQNLVRPGGNLSNVRLKREDEKKAGEWKWRDETFAGTREMNGLRVVMAVINNWDLKDANNAIYKEGGERVYIVSDLGASFGTTGRGFPKGKSKGDLESYTRSKFIRRVTSSTVDFQTPSRPSLIYIVNPKEYIQRVHLEWIGRNVPLQDAKWIGGLLARLSPKQIRDAFRAAGYPADEAEGFAKVVERRVAELTRLQAGATD